MVVRLPVFHEREIQIHRLVLRMPVRFRKVQIKSVIQARDKVDQVYRRDETRSKSEGASRHRQGGQNRLVHEDQGRALDLLQGRPDLHEDVDNKYRDLDDLISVHNQNIMFV